MKYVYGPVPSRRLGLSLGVDLVPKKVCSYNCIYCQIGRTTLQTIERKEYLPAGSILADVREALEEWAGEVDYVTISGSGEPTLNERLGEIIRGIKEMTEIPVAVITNGSLLFMEEVRREVAEADLVLPSLDAVTPAVFETINRPHPSLSIQRIIEGIRDFRREFRGEVWLEVLFCRGINDQPKEIRRLKEVISEINPQRVHLNTVTRPGAEDYAFALSAEKLRKIQQEWGEGVEVVTDFKGCSRRTIIDRLEEKILKLVAIRPVTLEDLSRTLGVRELELVKTIEKLLKEKRLTFRVFNQRIYYEAAQALENS